MKYRTLSWERERRVVLVVLPNSRELFPEHFYLITGKNCPILGLQNAAAWDWGIGIRRPVCLLLRCTRVGLFPTHG